MTGTEDHLHLKKALRVGVVAFLVLMGGAVVADDQEPPAETEAPNDLARITVLDEQGTPIEADVLLLDPAGRSPLGVWTPANADGVILIPRPAPLYSWYEPEAGVVAIIRGETFGWMEQLIPYSEDPQEYTLTPGPNRMVTMEILPPPGRQLPSDFHFSVFVDDMAPAAWTGNVLRRSPNAATRFTAAMPVALGEGRFRVRIPESVEAYWLLVHVPDFIRYAKLGPVHVPTDEETVVTVQLPTPAGCSLTIEPAEGWPTDYEEVVVHLGGGIEFGRGRRLNTGLDSHTFSTEQVRPGENPATLTHDFSNLAPGRYSVQVSASWPSTPDAPGGPTSCRHMMDEITLVAGQAESLSCALRSWNAETAERLLTGEDTISIEFRKADGSLVTSGMVTLSISLEEFWRKIPVFEGAIPPNGRITVENMPRRQDAQYVAELGDLYHGDLPHAPNEDNVYAVSIPPQVGEPAPNITLASLANPGTSFDLESLRGQVVFLDFWASWCGPCQAPMASFNELLEKRTDWAGKVTIIGASIDRTREDIMAHLERRKWWNVRQSWCEEGGGSSRAVAPKTYAVAAVPHGVLIDQDGILRGSGHLSPSDVEAEIDRLLAEPRVSAVSSDETP